MSTFPVSFAAFGLGGMEIFAILLIVLLLFGGAKLPSLAKGLGQSIKEFKKASKEDDTDTKPSEEKKEIAKTHGTN